MAFYVGQKVVCVNAGQRPGRFWMTPTPPRVGDHYTVVGFTADPFTGEEGLLLAEISNFEGSEDWGFASFRFRPIVERKTDISIFKAMLNPSKTEVEA